LVRTRDLAGGGPWDIAWCSGAGVVATPREVLVAELEQFRAFTADLTRVGAGSDVAAFLAS
jgi:hypothetical protein